jgi:hypothetical protein
MDLRAKPSKPLLAARLYKALKRTTAGAIKTLLLHACAGWQNAYAAYNIGYLGYFACGINVHYILP